MALLQNSLYIIVCEGESERAYIQELNKLFREMEIAVTLIPVCVGTGFFSNVVTTYRKLRKNNQRTKIYIWVDWDIYARNDRQTLDSYMQRSPGIPAFLFSRQNFEDFIVTHLNADRLEQWIDICRKSGHLQTPLHAEQYLPLFKDNLFPQYQKGDIPFQLTKERIIEMIHNQCKDDMPLHCEFSEVIREILDRRSW